jgi:hypothetical protein
MAKIKADSFVTLRGPVASMIPCRRAYSNARGTVGKTLQFSLKSTEHKLTQR